MSEGNLHPSVREFKGFMKEHPKLIEEVRKNGRSWQEYYEKWVLLGEDDPFWENYRSGGKRERKNTKKGSQKELINQLMKLSESIDLEKVQSQVDQINGAITTIQELLGQFQSTDSHTQPYNRPNQSFDWYKD